MYPGKTEPMIKNTTHSSIGCNGMANNDDYHGLEMYKNHAKDSTTEGYMQPDPTTMECGHHGMWPNQSLQSQGNAPIETEPMIKNTTHPLLYTHWHYYQLHISSTQRRTRAPTPSWLGDCRTQNHCRLQNQPVQVKGEATEATVPGLMFPTISVLKEEHISMLTNICP